MAAKKRSTVMTGAIAPANLGYLEYVGAITTILRSRYGFTLLNNLAIVMYGQDELRKAYEHKLGPSEMADYLAHSATAGGIADQRAFWRKRREEGRDMPARRRRRRAR